MRAIWGSLGEAPRSIITGVDGELFRDLRLILGALDARYLLVTRQELRMALVPLASISIMENFENAVARHRRVHTLFSAAGQ